MKAALSIVYFLLGAHMLDASRHYWQEDAPFSFAWNLVWGIAAVLIGLAILLHA